MKWSSQEHRRRNWTAWIKLCPSSWLCRFGHMDPSLCDSPFSTYNGHDRNSSCLIRDSLAAQMLKNLPAMWETWVWALGWEDLLEKGMAIHSSILAWRILWTEEPGERQSMVSQRSDMTEQLILSFSLGLGNIYRMFRTGSDMWWVLYNGLPSSMWLI